MCNKRQRVHWTHTHTQYAMFAYVLLSFFRFGCRPLEEEEAAN